VTVPDTDMPDNPESGSAEPRISVSVQAEPADLESWLALARRLEAAGFAALLMGDHPGSGASPWPALGCAAAVTRTLRLGTYVVQAGVREPMHVAADAATLNLLAPGRVLLGIGAGHTPREWSDIGRDRPSPSERAGRLAEFAEAVAGLLAGQSVTLDGQYLAVRDARLDGVLAGPAQASTAQASPAPVRLVIGGGHPRLLRAAARWADVAGLAGLGRTLPDGHQHEVRWSAADLRGQLDLIRAEASRAGRGTPGLEALVQVVRVTDDRDAALAEVGAEIPSAAAEDLAQTR
jgi:alkanesulfonate monooxygenase SsuD/methylene tetrahydromethanopterin reductase-like flavin-dependent oxidoreductase (luciferase family)